MKLMGCCVTSLPCASTGCCTTENSW